MTKIVIDFEVTSLKCRCPIQIGLLVVNEKLEIQREFESLIKPFDAHIWDDKAQAVHGINKSQLKNAPSIENVALIIAGIFRCHESMIHKNEIIYHASGDFDLKILSDLSVRGGTFGAGMPYNWCTYNTLKESRRHNLFSSYKLTDIAKVLGVDYELKAHDALSDAKVTLELMREIRKYE